MGIVVDNGALFRGNTEEAIRGRIIEKDWVERIRTRYAVKQYKERLRGAFGEQPASH